MRKPKAKIKKLDKPVPIIKRPLTEEEADLTQELNVASALEAVAVSEGGQIILNGLVRDIVGLVSTLSIKYKTATMIELVSTCADLKTKLDTLHVLSRAGKNKAYLIEQLKETLKE